MDARWWPIAQLVAVPGWPGRELAGHEMIRGLAGLSGTVPFLFSNIEGSTKLCETAPMAMGVALERHNTIVHRRDRR